MLHYKKYPLFQAYLAIYVAAFLLHLAHFLFFVSIAHFPFSFIVSVLTTYVVWKPASHMAQGESGDLLISNWFLWNVYIAG